MSSLYRFLALILLLGGTIACTSGPHSSAGFRLPAGDVERGRRAFLALECNRCHEVAGVGLPRTDAQPAATVKLGGITTRMVTDGYLATSIIHPGYRTAPGTREMIASRAIPAMPDYAERVTGRDLADLVAFLQDRYQPMSRIPNPAYY